MTWLINPHRFGGPALPAFTVASLLIGPGEVGATLTDFPIRVRLQDMPAAFWSAVASDGSDIRVTTEDGTQLPIDLVTINYAGETGTLFFRATLLTTGQTFYVQAGSGASAPAVTDPIGRNAVWSSYHRAFVFAGNSGADRTGSGVSVAFFNSAAISGGQLSTVPANSYAEFDASHSDDWTLSFLPESGANNIQTMIAYRNTAGNDMALFYNRGNFDGNRWRTANWNGVTETFNTSYDWTALDSLAYTRQHYLAMGRDNLFETLYADGELRSSATAAAQRPAAATKVRVSFPIADAHRGLWNVILLRHVAPEEHWMRAEFRNWAEGIWLDSFGGVGAYELLYTASAV